VRIPAPASDLAAAQVGERIVLTFSPPTKNTDGSPAELPSSVEVRRLVEERQADPAPVGEEEFLARSELAIEIAGDSLPKHLRDGRWVIEDAHPFADRAVAYRKRFRYAARTINRKRQTAGLSNQVWIAPVPIPDPPGEISFLLDQEFVRLTWKEPPTGADPPHSAHLVGYNVYRTEDPSRIPAVPMNPDPIRDAVFEDRRFEFEKTYYYAVSVVASTATPAAESLPSRLVAVQTRDTFPPSAPTSLHAVPQEGGVALLWSPSEAPDVVGYRVYRRDLSSGDEKAVVAEPALALSFRDSETRAGGRYEYRVAAVDRFKNEGPPRTITIEVP